MTQYYDDTAKDYAERAEAAAESASQSKQQALTAATNATTQASIATNAAQNAAVLVKSELENDVRAMKDSALSAASQASANAAAASGSAVDASHDAIDADQSRQAAQAAQTAAETAQTAAETAMGNAASSAGAAAASAQAAATSESNAAGSASAAATSESNAATSESNAGASAQNAATSEENAENSAKLSKSWAVGDTGVRQDEDTNNAKYWADQSRQFSPDNKANKPSPLPEENGHLAEVDMDGNLVTSDVKSEQVAKRDGYYGQDGLGAHTAEQLIDPNAPGTDRKFGFDTACGDITISDNGNAMPEKLMGTTHVANQLVHDTNMNTKSSMDGKLALTDAVGGNLSKLEIHGGCVVHNQLAKESVAKTVTGTGRLGCSDGVAGNAESFVMTAPRSVVMNQLVQNGDFSDSTTGWSAENGRSRSITDGIMTVSSTDTINNDNGVIRAATTFIAGHTYILHIQKITALLEGKDLHVKFHTSSLGTQTLPYASYKDGLPYTWRFTSASNQTGRLNLSAPNIDVIAPILSFGPVQLVDLTQYFSGNTTLINSITSWDDLVAYDPSFASYVPYNTGTVKGVQPTVKVNHATDVACPVELFGVSDTIGDSFDAVSGKLTRSIGNVDMGTLTYMNNYQNTDSSYPYGWIIATITGVEVTNPSVLCIKYSGKSRTTDKSIYMSFINDTARVYIIDSSFAGKTGTEIATALSGVYLYYELATPTTSQYTSTTIPTVDIYNSAVQTSNERLASLSMTYQGREQTIALDPTHTYVFNDNQTEDSLVTNESSIDAVGGEDMLVDLTQFYNGDTNKISQIQRWASLSTRFHRYRDLMPYNPGTVEPDTPVVRNYPDEYAYGVIYDPNQSSPACVKVELRNGVVSEVTDFASMPCHQLYRCVMDDLANRHIAYYLDDEDSNKKYNGTRNGVTSDGTASVLTGADGDVMVEIPISYWYLDEDYNGEGKVLWLISDRPFMGTHGPAEIHDFFYVSPDGATCRTQYVGAYKASVCNADGTPINTTEGALAQSTGTASTNIARSIAGALPYVNVSQNDLLARAKRNNASTVNTQFHQWLFILMIVERASLNTQLISQGYSNGIQNAFCFWRKSGRVNAGNGTAEIFANESSQDMDNFQSLKVGSTTVQRDTLMDADGRYAWSIYNRGASSTRYFTDSPTPVNGDPVYSASTGDTTAGTVASYTIKAASARVIQFQYRGIENPFGEVWEFEHGIQKYSHAFTASIKYSNVVYYRDPVKYGANSIAWTTADGTTTIWSAKSTTSPVFSDEDLTTQLGTSSVNSYRYDILGYWETLSTTEYTGTEQQAAANPSYTWRRHRWPMASGWIKKFDPRTFLNLVNGGSASTYLCDYYYDNAGTGSRVVFRGGLASNGAYAGLGYVYVNGGLTSASVNISGRLSA